jgi:hypothetical protein
MDIDIRALGTAELDQLLEAIALERAKREPAVTMEQPQKMEAALDPKWYLSTAGANTFLQLRHPGYGWVGYLIPPASRAALATVLLQQALMPPAVPGTAPASTPVAGGGTLH